jgi:8-oxo-dGTP pyrophosphatase MutT (NUDIX family)
VIDPGETPEEAAVREVFEETPAKVRIRESVGIQELEVSGPKPPGYRWPYPISVQVYYLCDLVELTPFQPNHEAARELGFFGAVEARGIPTMRNHDALYEEALRRVAHAVRGSRAGCES